MTAISQIDKQIDAVRAELRRRETVKPLSAASWQAAWDRHPELREQETNLFRQRGVAQQERDAKAHKEWLRAKPRTRTKKCPTCGSNTLIAA